MKVIAFLGLLALNAAPAWAVLGESARSVEKDEVFARGAMISISRPGYSIQQISAASGHVIKEYVSQDGTVFGVSWQGPTVPNLQQLLGSYFARFQQAARSSSPRRHGPVVLRSDDVVIESGGHLRAFHGRAYLPHLLPDGVSEAVVQ